MEFFGRSRRAIMVFSSCQAGTACLEQAHVGELSCSAAGNRFLQCTGGECHTEESQFRQETEFARISLEGRTAGLFFSPYGTSTAEDLLSFTPDQPSFSGIIISLFGKTEGANGGTFASKHSSIESTTDLAKNTAGKLGPKPDKYNPRFYTGLYAFVSSSTLWTAVRR